jgi:hypothetical protein
MLQYFRRHSSAAVFHHPLDPAPRTAILTGGFQSSHSVRVFPDGLSECVIRFKPACLAAPFSSLKEMVCHGITMELAHSVVAFTYDAGLLLGDDDRDLLWAAFGVPVFEQYLNWKNELLASECEAHAGLHIVSGCGSFAIDKTPCACGNLASRLVTPQTVAPEAELALA